MHRAAVVPDHEVPRLLPRHRAHELRLGGEVDQLVEQSTPLIDGPANDVLSVLRDVERLAFRARMHLHQLVA